MFSRTAFRIVRTKCYPNAHYWENGKTTYSKPLDTPHLISCFCLRTFRLKTSCSERTLFISRWHCICHKMCLCCATYIDQVHILLLAEAIGMRSA